jgi:hypothetical protein
MFHTWDFTCLPHYWCATSSSLTLTLLPSRRQIEARLLQAWISIVSSFNWTPSLKWRSVQRSTLVWDPWPALTIIIKTPVRKYSQRPMSETESVWDISNNIPTCHVSTNLSQRIHNQWHDLIPESAITRTEGQIKSVSASCIPTTLATSNQLRGQQQERRAGESQKDGDKKSNF